MKTRIFGVSSHPAAVDVALLVLRIVTGVALMIHGFGKIQHPFSWMGPDSNFHPIFQALSATAEFIGGLALVLGFLTRIAGFGIMCNFIVAVHMHMMVMKDPFVNLKGGGAHELPLLFLVIGILFMLVGPGRISLDKLVSGEA